MKKNYFFTVIITIVWVMYAHAQPAQIIITGAGSTFIYPVLSAWAKDYQKIKGQIINYQGVGSSAGISQLKQATIDFAASDKPLEMNELNDNHWTQVPVVVSGIVAITNIEGIANNDLTIDGATLADIYLGEIAYWDDARIKKLNPSLLLPHKKIVTVHRADGSGTTFNFTYYLNQVSPLWQQRVGFGALVKWPGHYALGAKGNGGVASQVKLTSNSIGYVEFAYAAQEQLHMVSMINASGQRVTANLATFNSAAEQAAWDKNKGYSLLLTNQPGSNSWPIDAVSFVLVPINNPSYSAIMSFLAWGISQDAQTAKSLGYVMAPQHIIQEVQQHD